jgi:ribosome-binding protein aMBF1 (putative translation factor)
MSSYLERAARWRLELRCRMCGKTFHPALEEIGHRLSVVAYCPECQPARDAPHPEPAEASLRDCIRRPIGIGRSNDD